MGDIEITYDVKPYQSHFVVIQYTYKWDSTFTTRQKIKEEIICHCDTVKECYEEIEEYYPQVV